MNNKAFIRYCKKRGIELYTQMKVQSLKQKSKKVKTLGSGTFGQCVRYIGEDFDLVVKVFLGASQRRQREMVTEAKLLRKVRKLPGFQRLVAVCTNPQSLVSDYAGDIVEKYVEKKKIDYEFLRQLIIQVGSSIQEFARKGYQHNDIKENNVCVKKTHNGFKFTLIDIGLAREIGAIMYSRKNYPGDEVDWMAPEVSHGYKITANSDTYSLAHMCLSIIKESGVIVPPHVLQHLRDSTNRDPNKRPRIQDLIDRLQGKSSAAKRSRDSFEESNSKRPRMNNLDDRLQGNTNAKKRSLDGVNQGAWKKAKIQDLEDRLQGKTNATKRSLDRVDEGDCKRPRVEDINYRLQGKTKATKRSRDSRDERQAKKIKRN